MSIGTKLKDLYRRVSGIEPDPAVNLIPGERITSNFYPYPGDPDRYNVRLYAEKNWWTDRMRIKYQFMSASNDNSALGAAMMDQSANDFIISDDRNLTVREAIAKLATYEFTRKAQGATPIPAPKGELHYTQATKILDRASPAP